MMTALHILLLLLKWLGILLLALLGLALLLLLIVLFVPVRYDLKLRFRDGALRARLRVGWLCGLLRVFAGWIEDYGLCRIKVGPKEIRKLHFGNWPSEDPSEGPSEEPAEPENLTYVMEEIPVQSSEAPRPETAGKAKKAGKTKPEAAREAEAVGTETAGKADGAEKDAAETGTASEPEKQGKRSAKRKNRGKKEKNRRIDRKKSEKSPENGKTGKKKRGKFKRLLEEVKAFWEDAANQKTLALIRKQLKKIGKHLLPTRFLLEGVLGFGNPAKTGQIIGKIYALYPLYGEHIRISGDYAGDTKNIYWEVKGRLRLAVPVGAALRLLADRNFRGWLKLLKKRSEAPAGTEGSDAQDTTA